MSKVETKEDLLHFMKKHGACEKATEWVKSRKEETFLEIWNACPDFNWLFWLMYKQDPVLADKWWDYVYNETEWEALPYSIAYNFSLQIFKRAYRG